jgi:glucosamine--fructose-6-phosphate aminotransferase (isomerizing)
VLACGWSRWSDSVAKAPAAFVAARGYGFAAAREIALKLTETLRVPALGYSGAELRHGPRAAATIDELIGDLCDAGETVFSDGGPAGALPWIGDDHPVCDAVTMLIPGCAAFEAAAGAAKPADQANPLPGRRFL